MTRKDLKTFHTELSKHIEQALGYEAEILNEATRNGNRSVEELKRETAVKRLKALNDDLEAKRRACIEYGKVIDARFRPPPDAKKNCSETKSPCPNGTMKCFVFWQAGKGLKVRRKSRWK